MLERATAIELVVNGTAHAIDDAPSDMHLAHFLREILGLTGTRIGCSIGECRACTVMVRHAPGMPAVTKQACMVSLRHVHGWEVTTVEGLVEDGVLHPVQEEILQEDAPQCGFCASGFVVAGAVARDQYARGLEQEVDRLLEAVAGHNLCRCTGYGRYRNALRRAVLRDLPTASEGLNGTAGKSRFLMSESPPAPAAMAPLRMTLSLAEREQLHYQPLFENPRLELIRLLRDAAEIEHSLLVQYLFAAFSIRIPDYSTLAGWPSHRYGGRPLHLLGVAIEEMIHLDVVNRLLVALGAAPHLGRQQFPYEQDIYPFEFRLESLSLKSVAKYVYVEASADAVDPAKQTTPEDKAFVKRLYETLDDGSGSARPNQVGSLYRKIDAVLAKLGEADPAAVDVDYWRNALRDLMIEGESEHFQLFRSLFDSTHAALPGPEVWDPRHPESVAVELKVSSGLPPAGQDVPDETDPALRHMSNLHYWAACMLLDQSYRRGGQLLNAARRHMTGPLRSLASALARRGEGIPFDPFPAGYAPGIDEKANLLLLEQLLMEIGFAELRFARHFPPDYSTRCALETAQELTTVQR